MSENLLASDVAKMIADDEYAGHYYAHGTTPLGGSDFWKPQSLTLNGVLGHTQNFHDELTVPFGKYVEMRKHPLIKVGFYTFVPPSDATADIRFCSRDAVSAGRALRAMTADRESFHAALLSIATSEIPAAENAGEMVHQRATYRLRSIAREAIGMED